jgi:isoleucyl-tRNA synthetase
LSALKEKKHLIAEELNVKDIIYHTDETSFVALIAKPNLRLLGKKVGSKMNEVHKAVGLFDQKILNQLLCGKTVEIEVSGEKIPLTSEDINVERKVLDGVIAHTLDEITVALDTSLTPELEEEGMAREIVNKINLMRKDMGFAVVDRIFVEVKTSSKVEACFHKHKDYICHETLARTFTFVNELEGDVLDFNAEPAVISLRICPRL